MEKDEITVVDPADVVNRQVKSNEKPKLTDWEKEPSLEQLKEDFTSSKHYHEEHMAKVVEWVNCFNAEGDYKAPEISGRSKIAPKLVRKQVEWRCPSLTEPFLSNPQFLKLTARTYEDTRAATQNELILNYQFQNKINMVKLMDEIVRSMATEGTAILKPSWVYEDMAVKSFKDEYEAIEDPAVVLEYQEINAKMQQDNTFAVTLTEAQKMGMTEWMRTGAAVRYVHTERKEITRQKVVNNHPDAEVCDIDDVYVDPTCKGKIEKAKFIIRKFTSCLADLEADGRYTQLDKVKAHVASNTAETSTKDTQHGFTFKDNARKQFDVYEYWGYWDTDDNDTLNPIVATWVGNTLIQLDRSPFSNSRLPFIFIPLVPIKNSLYGEPDAELLGDNQKIIGAVMRGLIDLLGRSANGQQGTARGFLDGTNKTRFNSGENYEFNPEMPPERAIHTHKFPELPMSAFNMINIMNNEAESLSGVKSFSQGVNGDALGKVAVGVRSTLDASAKRDAAILRRIAEGVKQLAYAFQEMNGIFLDESDVIRLTNDTYVPVDPENLNGDFDLKIDISSAEEDAAKVQDLSFLLQTGQNGFPFEFTQRILAEIAELKKLPALARFIREFKPEPDPVQQQIQQLELQKLMLENSLLQAQIAETSAKANVNAAEVGVRNQRAGNIQSNTDKNNLDFYKKAEGIDHQEAIDKINAQADANARNADLKHLNDMDAKRFEHNSGLLQRGADLDIQRVFGGITNQQQTQQ